MYTVNVREKKKSKINDDDNCSDYKIKVEILDSREKTLFFAEGKAYHIMSIDAQFYVE